MPPQLSATCGANGETSRTSARTASRGIAERRARWFTKTMRAEMAVLKANASMSVLTS